MKKNIPTYTLKNISQHGIVVECFKKRLADRNDNLNAKGIHRDSHYVFTFMETGEAKMMVVFKTFKISGSSVFVIMPGQVHQGLEMKNISGWFVAVNVDFIPDYVRTIFEEQIVTIKPIPINKESTDRLNTCAKLLNSFLKNEAMISKEGSSIVQSLFTAYAGIFASIYSGEIHDGKTKESRAISLTRQFRILLRREYKTLKSPSLYAKELNISSVYLTEIVKKVTGKSVTYWIQQEILTEAKRLLFFTDMTVKEIAYELGYEDHAYFSRLFSKLTNQTALLFRENSRR